MRYEYHRVREGPNYFVTYYKRSSRLIYDPKDAWRVLGVAKFTDSGKHLKEWCLEMDSTYNSEVTSDLVKKVEPRKDTSFASEALSEVTSDLEEESPTDNTKMVT